MCGVVTLFPYTNNHIWLTRKLSDCVNCINCSALQMQTAVTAHFSSKQLLLFVSERQLILLCKAKSQILRFGFARSLVLSIIL